MRYILTAPRPSLASTIDNEVPLTPRLSNQSFGPYNGGSPQSPVGLMLGDEQVSTCTVSYSKLSWAPYGSYFSEVELWKPLPAAVTAGLQKLAPCCSRSAVDLSASHPGAELDAQLRLQRIDCGTQQQQPPNVLRGRRFRIEGNALVFGSKLIAQTTPLFAKNLVGAKEPHENVKLPTASDVQHPDWLRHAAFSSMARAAALRSPYLVRSLIEGLDTNLPDQVYTIFVGVSSFKAEKDDAGHVPTFSKHRKAFRKSTWRPFTVSLKNLKRALIGRNSNDPTCCWFAMWLQAYHYSCIGNHFLENKNTKLSLRDMQNSTKDMLQWALGVEVFHDHLGLKGQPSEDFLDPYTAFNSGEIVLLYRGKDIYAVEGSLKSIPQDSLKRQKSSLKIGASAATVQNQGLLVVIDPRNPTKKLNVSCEIGENKKLKGFDGYTYTRGLAMREKQVRKDPLNQLQ